MEEIKLHFLGTGCAIPTKRHNHVAMLLQYKDENILIDCGEGTQRQFRYKELNPCKITKILITHWHGDHIFGLPGLLQTLAMNGYNKKLDIYVPKETAKFMEQIFRLFVFRGKINYKIHEVEEKFFENSDFILEGEKMEHGTPCLAYSFILKEKCRIDKKKLKKLKIPNSELIGELKNGKKIKIDGKVIDGKKLLYCEKGKKISFILDTSINKNCLKIAKDSDLLVCESTYSEKEENLAKEHNHLTSKDAAQIAKQSKAKKLILIHMSQRYEKNPKIIANESRKIFKNTDVANDLDSITI